MLLLLAPAAPHERKRDEAWAEGWGNREREKSIHNIKNNINNKIINFYPNKLQRSVFFSA